MRPRVAAIVPAAGCGKRLKSKTKKPFILLRGRPLVTYALTALEKSRTIDAILIAAERSSIKRFRNLVRTYKFKKVIRVVAGGSTRSASVRNCLKALGPGFEIVLIHDGARPFLDGPTIERSITLARRFGGCVTAVPENDTVKLADEDLCVRKTLDRREVFRAQTPQAFRYGLIKKAYASGSGKAVTDDAALVEAAGNKVKILIGSYRNIKITTKEDLKFAEVLLCGQA